MRHNRTDERGGIILLLQKTIAERAGVSYATVSRAFTSSAKVKPQTLQRIRNAMLELGITNSDEILLGKTFISKAVLLVVNDISNQFYSRVARGVCEGLAPFGYSVILCCYGADIQRELSALYGAVDSGYSGIIMITIDGKEEVSRFIHSSSIPVVLVNRYIQSLDLDVVRIDNYRGGYLAAQHLIDHGHRRIAHLAGIPDSGTTIDRRRGFQDAMDSHSLDFTAQDVVYGDSTPKSGRDFADWLISQGPRYSAAFVGNDYMAAGLVRRLREVGQRVPEDYSVVCFDESYLVNEEGLDLTTISCDPVLMGRSAAEIFLKRLNDLLGERFRIVYSPQLTQRSSVAARLSARRGKRP